jgi:hypothetical protein
VLLLTGKKVGGGGDSSCFHRAIPFSGSGFIRDLSLPSRIKISHAQFAPSANSARDLLVLLGSDLFSVSCLP